MSPATSKKKLEYIKKWKAEHPENVKATTDRYYQRHRVEKTIYFKKYRKEHAAERAAYNIQWRLKNPEKYQARIDRNNRIAKATRLPKRILFFNRRIELDKNPRTGKCSMCGNEGRTEIHHIKYHEDDPLKDTIEVCAKCHRIREQKFGEWRTTKKR